MEPETLNGLQARTLGICQRWEALLRIERVNTPLASPDALAYLIPESVAEILDTARRIKQPPPLDTARRIPKPDCGCGRNPYLAYFVAGEQAMVEALVLVQAENRDAPASSREPDLARVYTAVRTIAAREMDAFCGVCTCRCEVDLCRFRSKAASAAQAPICVGRW